MLNWPEEEWERQAPLIEFTPLEVQNVMTEAGLGEVRHYRNLDGGKFNTNFEVLGYDYHVVIRIYERDPLGLARDEALEKILPSELPRPKLVHAVHIERPIGVFEFKHGVKPHELEHLTPQGVESLAYSIGELIGGYAGAKSFEEHGLLDGNLELSKRFGTLESSFEDLIEWSLTKGRAGGRMGPTRAARLESLAQRHAQLLRALDGQYGLLHGDLKFSNILVDAETLKVSALLDWEFVYSGAPLLDLAIFLRHSSKLSPLSKGAIAGFESSGATVTNEWWETLRLWDLMNLCGFLNGSQHRQKTFDHVLQLLDRNLAEIEELSG